MADCFHELSDSTIDFSPNSNESKLKKSIKYIIDDKYNLASNKKIADDISHLSTESEKNEVSFMISDITFGSSKKSLKESTLKKLLEIDTLSQKSDYKQAYNLAELEYKKLEDENQSEQYLTRLINLSERLNDNLSQRIWAKTLVEQDPNNTNYIFQECNAIENLDDKCEYIESKIRDGLENYELYNKLAIIRNKKSQERKPEAKKIEDIAAALSSTTSSIDLEPSPENPAWSRYAELKIEQYKIEKSDLILSEISSTLEKLKNTNKNSKEYIKYLVTTSFTKLIDIRKNVEIDFDSILNLISEKIKLSDKKEAREIKDFVLDNASANLFDDKGIVNLRKIYNSAIIHQKKSSAIDHIRQAEYELYINGDIKKS